MLQFTGVIPISLHFFNPRYFDDDDDDNPPDMAYIPAPGSPSYKV